MMKLEFDKETKIISVYEVNEEEAQDQDGIKKELQEHNEMQEHLQDQGEKREKKVTRVKIFLQNNKIFFEIFSSVLLGIMSFIISIVGLQTNKRSADLYQKQLDLQQEQAEKQSEQNEILSQMQQKQLEIYQRELEIKTNDRAPHFKMNSEYIYEDDYSCKLYYTIKDMEEKINYGHIKHIDTVLTIYYLNYSINIYYYNITETFFVKNSSYDDNNKEFVFSGYEYFTYRKLAYDLKTELESIYGYEHIYVDVDFYLTIDYTDYKNEEYEKTYNFTPDNIIYVDYDYTEGKIYLGAIEFETDISSIAQEISEIIENSSSETTIKNTLSIYAD